MKNLFLSILVILFFLMPVSANAQGYFAANVGHYLDVSKFKLNPQSNLLLYQGKYTAASETYDSHYIFEISSNEESLNITAISGGSEDGEHYSYDTLIFSDVKVINGTFEITFPEASVFKFVKTSYSYTDENGTKTVKCFGILMEEYKMFAEKYEE